MKVCVTSYILSPSIAGRTVYHTHTLPNQTVYLSILCIKHIQSDNMQPGYTDIPPPQYMHPSIDPQHCFCCMIGMTCVILGVMCLLVDWDVLVIPEVIVGIVCSCVSGDC